MDNLTNTKGIIIYALLKAAIVVSQVRFDGCHSALDAESRLSKIWIPAFAGMTTHKVNVDKLIDCHDKIVDC